MDGVDDLGVIDPSQVCRRDPEVCMPELALYDKQRDPLGRHLDGVDVAELVRGEPATNPGGWAALRNWPRIPAAAHGRPRVGRAGRRTTRRRAASCAAQATGRDAPTPSGPSRFRAGGRPSRREQGRRRVWVKVGLGQRERFADPQPGSPQHDDHAAEPDRVGPVAGRRITAMISSTVGGSGGYRRPLFRGVRPW